MNFNTDGTRRLGVYLDTGLQFKTYKNLTLTRVRMTHMTPDISNESGPIIDAKP